MQQSGAIPSFYNRTLRELKGGILAAGALSAVISLLMLTGSIYMLQVYDRVLGSGSIPTLIALFGIVVVLYSFLAFYDGLRMRLLSRLSLQIDNRLATSSFRQDLLSFRAASATTFERDLGMVRAFVAGPAMIALFDLPFTVLFLGVLFLIHPVLGLMTVGGMALAAALALVNRMVLKTPMAEATQAEARQRRFADGARLAAPVLAALGMTGAITGRWDALHREQLQRQQAGSEPSEILTALSRALRMLLQSGLLTAAAWLVIDGKITSGTIVASSILSGRALGPVDQLIGQWRSIAATWAAHGRLDQGLRAENARTMDLPPISGAIEIDNLTSLAPARVEGTDRARILDGISFSLEPGEGLGIVGASASGKSTLARLLVGAIAADSGEIRFDGATAQQWDPDRLGRQIGYLPQRIDLLPGTVRDNIARFAPEATDTEVIRAATAAGVHDMILRLPKGYETDLSQGEVPLSGGQIQRIGLARALFGAPRLLVLDEPNAHLDTAGEAALSKAIRELRANGVTVIVFAHRAGALAAVDRLMVLQSGRIVQDGDKNEVLAMLGGGTPPTGGGGGRPVKVKIHALHPRTTQHSFAPVQPAAPTRGPAPSSELAQQDDRMAKKLLFRHRAARSA